MGCSGSKSKAKADKAAASDDDYDTDAFGDEQGLAPKPMTLATKPPSNKPPPPPSGKPGSAKGGSASAKPPSAKGGQPPPPDQSSAPPPGPGETGRTGTGPPPGNTSLAEKIAGGSPEQLVVVCFFKPNCEKCGMVNRFYETLVVTYPNVVFLDANISRNHEAVKELNLKSVPTFIAFKNHREVGRYEGVNKDAIEGMVKAFNG